MPTESHRVLYDLLVESEGMESDPYALASWLHDQGVRVLGFRPDSLLVSHARQELEHSEIEPELRPSILMAVEAFASYQGHSGTSAEITADIIYRLLKLQTLAPITNDPEEWIDVADFADGPLWQNRRQSDCFSDTHGVTYYCLSEQRRWVPHILRRTRLGYRLWRPTHVARKVI